jgi:hypothetical protein
MLRAGGSHRFARRFIRSQFSRVRWLRRRSALNQCLVTWVRNAVTASMLPSGVWRVPPLWYEYVPDLSQRSRIWYSSARTQISHPYTEHSWRQGRRSLRELEMRPGSVEVFPSGADDMTGPVDVRGLP